MTWLPLSLQPRLQALHYFSVNDNPLPVDCGGMYDVADARHMLPEIYAATRALAMIREPAAEMLLGLAELDLPALVQVEIIDAAWDNDIRMAAKWDLVVAVKHFHQR